MFVVSHHILAQYSDRRATHHAVGFLHTATGHDSAHAEDAAFGDGHTVHDFTSHAEPVVVANDDRATGRLIFLCLHIVYRMKVRIHAETVPSETGVALENHVYIRSQSETGPRCKTMTENHICLWPERYVAVISDGAVTLEYDCAAFFLPGNAVVRID